MKAILFFIKSFFVLIINSLRLISLITLSLVSHLIYADTYEDENSLYYFSRDIDAPTDVAISSWAVDLKGVHYFQQVDTTDKPLAEAAYLQRASGVTLNLFQDAQTAKNSYQNSRIKTQDARLSVDVYVPDTFILVGAGIVATKNIYEDKTTLGGVVREYKSESSWNSNWTAKLGVAPVDRLLIWSEFIEGYKPKEYWNINGKYIFPFTSSGWLNLELSYVENNNSYEKSSSQKISIDYYLDSTLSVGLASTAKNYTDQEDVTVNEIRARKFFGESFSINAAFQKIDEDSVAIIGGSIRF